MDIAVLDFAKAFDTVPHDHLLGKIDHYGINNTIHPWVKSFLKGRTQRVVVDGEQSSSADVESGVPQGTVPGPLLFLIYIKDLPDSVTSQVRLFADDCLLYRVIKTVEDQVALQEDLRRLEQWCVKWGMRLNSSKCEVMTICRSRNQLSRMYSIGGEVLKTVDKAKYLGVTITNNLSWSYHTSITAGKANGKIGFLWRNLRHCPKQLKGIRTYQ